MGSLFSYLAAIVEATMLFLVERLGKRAMTSQEPSFLSRGISRRRALRLGLQGAALCASPAMPAICPPDPGPAGQSAVEAVLRGVMSNSNDPSISYALISCGNRIYADAFGLARPPNVAASPSTLYQAASISKTLAAVGGLCAVQANTKGCTLIPTSPPFRRRGNCRAERPASRCDGCSA